MELNPLVEHYLEIDGERYDASAPEWGDATLSEAELPGSEELITRDVERHDHVSIGIPAYEIDRLHAPIARAELCRRNGDRILALRIEKVDPDFGVVVGVPLTH